MLGELETLQYFHFLRPQWSLLLVPLAVIAWAQTKQRASRDRFGGIIAPHLLTHLRVHQYDSRWFNPRTLSLVFLLLVMLVLMGPTWRQQPSPLNQDDAALVILIDVSSSMQQKDAQPSRLERAKQKVSDLLALRPDKKAALIAYAGTAHTVLSLTAEQDILKQYLAAIKSSVMPRSGKFPEYALPLADTVLRDTTTPATILLLTDGTGGDSQAAFEEYFQSSEHQLLVLGMGTLEADVPLEQTALKRLASVSNGSYQSLTVDNQDVKQLSRMIDTHYVIVEDSALPWLDSGYPLLFPAIALFLLWFRKGWTLTWNALFVALIVGGPSPPVSADANKPNADIQHGIAVKQWFIDQWLTRDQQGRILMQLQNYPEAAQRFSNPMWKGMAYYYNEEFMRAAEYFSRSDSNAALFNEANARAQARDYLRAVHRYDRLLARAPDYPGAAANRATVQSIIDEINLISESQQPEAGVSGQDKELDSGDAIPAQGADEITWEKAEVTQLSAEDILQDESTAEMWLRAVQQDPSSFLTIKFAMQLQLREDRPAPAAEVTP